MYNLTCALNTAQSMQNKQQKEAPLYSRHFTITLQSKTAITHATNAILKANDC